MSTIKCCDNCLYLASHEKCGHCSDTDYCLGSCAEVAANGGQYLYRHFEPGTWPEALARLRKLEAEGKRNIVIGGIGEAEVNTKHTPEATFENLCNVAEQCGYFVTKGIWSEELKQIDVYNHGAYRITYINNVYVGITRIKQEAEK